MLLIIVLGVVLSYIIIGVLTLIYFVKIGEYNPHDEGYESALTTIFLWPFGTFFVLLCKFNEFLKKLYDDARSKEDSTLEKK